VCTSLGGMNCLCAQLRAPLVANLRAAEEGKVKKH
jgi:hypothetical protein